MKVSWEVLKSFAVSRDLSIQFIDTNDYYFVFAYDNGFSLDTNIIKNDSADQVDFETNYKPNANKRLNNLTNEQKVLRVACYKPEGDDITIVTHDWCDKCTWYCQSIRVVDEVLSLESGKTFSSSHTYWIDLTHGRLYGEDSISSNYLVEVKIDDVVQDESYYSVDYENGKITFVEGTDTSGVVKASYSYSNGSMWVLVPNQGKKLHLQYSEVQFSKDVLMNKGVHFEVWGYDPDNLPNKKLYKKIAYKNIKDIINAGNRGTGYIPKFDTLPEDILVFPFNYATIQTLKSSEGAELRIHLEEDTPFGGSYSTTTFYALSQDE